jgi:prevent-host-death family protein
METFSIRDLRERTGDLVRQAENGGLSVISKHGQPLFVAVPLDEAMIEHGVRVALACRLFEESVLSAQKAARFAGVPLETFMERLASLGVAMVAHDADDIDTDMAVLNDA